MRSALHPSHPPHPAHLILTLAHLAHGPTSPTSPTPPTPPTPQADACLHGLRKAEALRDELGMESDATIDQVIEHAIETLAIDTPLGVRRSVSNLDACLKALGVEVPAATARSGRGGLAALPRRGAAAAEGSEAAEAGAPELTVGTDGSTPMPRRPGASQSAHAAAAPPASGSAAAASAAAHRAAEPVAPPGEARSGRGAAAASERPDSAPPPPPPALPPKPPQPPVHVALRFQPAVAALALPGPLGKQACASAHSARSTPAAPAAAPLHLCTPA